MDWERKFIASASDQDLEDSARLQLVSVLNNASADNKWLGQFAPVIPQGASAAEYQQWLQQVKYAGEMEINSLASQVDFLNEQEAEIYSQYTRASNRSYGLSSSLVIEEISERSIDQYAVRPMGLIILAGGAIGLLLWTALWLTKVTL